MTSILKEDDKIFTMYKQYKELIHRDAEEGENRVYGTDQLAAQLTVAHMLDHVVCLNIGDNPSKEDRPPTVKKLKKAPQTLLEISSGTTTTSSSDTADIDWKITRHMGKKY
tara:strand:- start:224 stop:556 length:333 start_codon:yes stop_codon:yes gene_type:complete